MAEQKKTTTPRKKAGSTSTEAKKKTTSTVKAAPKKSTAAPKTSKPRAKKATPSAVSRVSEEMRQHMIREAAYYRALNRGFAGATDLEDWLVAEQEINAMLGRLTD